MLPRCPPPTALAAPFVVLTAIALAAGALALLLLVGSARAGGAQTSRSTATANRNAAARDATMLLGRLALPPGATNSRPTRRRRRRPRSPSVRPRASPIIDRHRWWTMPGHKGVGPHSSEPTRHAAGNSLCRARASRARASGGHVLAYRWPAIVECSGAASS